MTENCSAADSIPYANRVKELQRYNLTALSAVVDNGYL